MRVACGNLTECAFLAQRMQNAPMDSEPAVSGFVLQTLLPDC